MEVLVKALQDLGQYTGWDYILLGANVLSVIISAIALFAAIRVPKKIAKSQNDISLFEKRYECYTMIQTFLVCASQLETVNTNKAIQVVFRLYFDQPENIIEDLNAIVLITKIKQKQATLISGEFLFSNYDSNLLLDIIDVGIWLIDETTDLNKENLNLPISEKVQQLKKQYCQLCKQFDSVYSESILQELNLSKKIK